MLRELQDVPPESTAPLTLPDRPPEALAALAPEAQPEPGKATAVLVAHGMGQQVAFETLDMVAKGLLRPLKDPSAGSWKVVGGPRTRTVRVGRQDLRRVEVDIEAGPSGGTRRRSVHLYEAYWAPLTEGKVTLRDVMGFLMRGGLHGAANGAKPFHRTLFGKRETFQPVQGTTFALLVGVAALLSLAAMNLVAFATLVDQRWSYQEALLAELTAGLLAFLVLLAALGVHAGLCAWARGRARGDARLHADLAARRDAGMAAFALALGGSLGFLAGGLALAIHHLVPLGLADAPSRLVAFAGVWLVLLAAALALVRRPLLLGVLAGLAAWGGASWLLATGAGMDRLPAAVAPPVAVLVLLGLVRLARPSTGSAERKAAGPQAPLGASSTRGRGREAAAFGRRVLAGALLGAAAFVLAPLVPLGGPGERLAASLGLLALAAIGLGLVPLLARPGVALRTLPLLLVGAGLFAALPLVVPRDGDGLPHPALVLVLWGLVAAVALVTRHFLVQFVGDVAAYVSPHRLDRFAELRSTIQARVKGVADAVYAMRTPDGKALAYDRVLVVGHSLGSVVAFDTLNGLLLDDEHAKGRDTPPSNPQAAEFHRDVAGRTKLFLTFGSPLDRTAFVFSLQQDGSAQIREALVTTFQPLVNNEAVREQIPWVNIHSPADIICNALAYYDRPDASNRGLVLNVEDPEASTPLAAHVEYWDNPLVWTHLVSAALDLSSPQERHAPDLPVPRAH